MPASAAGPLARRAKWGPVMLLAGYLLLAPAAFVLGPLAGLLLLSRPRTAREWTWIVVAAGASLLWIEQPGTLAGQITRAAAVELTGAYVALTIWRPAPGWQRAVAATLLGGLGLTLLMAASGIRWTALYPAAASALRDTNALRVAGRLLPAAARDTTAELLAAFFPALLAMIGIGGVQLAWTWHCRLAERPVGERFCTGESNS